MIDPACHAHTLMNPPSSRSTSLCLPPSVLLSSLPYYCPLSLDIVPSKALSLSGVEKRFADILVWKLLQKKKNGWNVSMRHGKISEEWCVREYERMYVFILLRDACVFACERCLYVLVCVCMQLTCCLFACVCGRAPLCVCGRSCIDHVTEESECAPAGSQQQHFPSRDGVHVRVCVRV